MDWFKKKKGISSSEKKAIPDGLWVKCDECGEIIYRPELQKRMFVCHKCNYHFRITSNEFKEYYFDENSSVITIKGVSNRTIKAVYTRRLAWIDPAYDRRIYLDKIALDCVTGDMIVCYDAAIRMKVTFQTGRSGFAHSVLSI